jgi:RNA polymerase sigma factor for flagellar operon FliA
LVTAAPVALASPQLEDVEGLVRSNLPLVGHLVREVLGRVPSHVSRDDLISAGMYALTVSASSFDASRGVPFARFAALRIRGAITDELRAMDWASRSVRRKSREVETARASLARTLGRTPTTAEIAQAVGFAPAEVEAVDADVQRASVLSLQAITADGDCDALPHASDSPEGLLLRREQIGYLHDAIAELPERLRTVVTEYFFEQRKLNEVATDLGVTESRVSQLRSEALALLYVGFQAGYERTGPSPEQPVRGRVAAARSAYVASVAARSSLAGRLGATTVLGEPRVGAGPRLRPAI